MLRSRLALPVGAPGTGRGRTAKARGGYRDAAEHRRKQQRLAILTARLARVDADLADGQVSLCAGGKGLARTRHQFAVSRFAAAADPAAAWRTARCAGRGHLSAPGHRGVPGGNRLMWLDDDGHLVVALPARLAELANHQPPRTKLPHYRLSRPAAFAHRGDEHAAAVARRQPTASRLSYDDQARRTGRWRLAATFPAHPTPARDDLDERRVAAVDLNADHLAVRLVDASGNPTRHYTRIPLAQTGTAKLRDARVREAVA